MLTIPLIVVGLLFFWLGWKARGIFEHRPRWLKWGKKKDATAANGTAAKPAGGNGVIDKLSRTGERIVGKGVETIFGKPKKPKDDAEDE